MTDDFLSRMAEKIVIGEHAYAARLETGDLTFFSRELATYEGGYVDGKYTTAEFIGEVARRGSEPARFAYADARLIFCRDESISDLIVSAARYPIENKVERIVNETIREEGQSVLGWRDVPVDNTDLGEAVKATEPSSASPSTRAVGCTTTPPSGGA